MSHRALVNGTAYEIKGGTALIDGTAYSIKSGKTLVGGTAYEVGFAKPVTITYSLGGTNYTHYNHVIHNGIEYTGDGSFVANIGDTILVRCAPGGMGKMAQIHLNDPGFINPVVTVSNDYAEYNYEVVSDATITKDTGSGTQHRGAINITDDNA